MAFPETQLTPGVYLWITMHLSVPSLLQFPSSQDLILRFYPPKSKDASAEITVKQKQYSKFEKKVVLR